MTHPRQEFPPASSPMARKRTLDSVVLNAESSPTPSIPTHSPIPSFQFSDEMSPASTTSASASTPSSSPFSQCNSNCASPIESDLEEQWGSGSPVVTPNREEDGGKRRRTSACRRSSHSTNRNVPGGSGGKAKGHEPWPLGVDEAFREALRIVPKVKLVKIRVHDVMLGRNQMIGVFILARTGQFRGHKQISSRVQVMKRISTKGDPDLVTLLDVSGPTVLDFEPGGAEIFFAHVKASHIRSYLDFEGPPRRREGGSPTSGPIDGLLSPYAPSQFPGLSHGGLHSPLNIGPSSPTLGLAAQLQNLSLPKAVEEPPSSCPIAPAQLCLWTHDTHSNRRHVYVSLVVAGVRGTTDLNDLQESSLRYPGLGNMQSHLPCQFLHVRLNLDIPTESNSSTATRLHAQLSLTSLQELPLTCITRIFLCGVQVVSLRETLSPSRTMPPFLGSTPTPSRPTIPSHSTVEGHKFCYEAPFATDFWTTFLRGKFGHDDGSSRVSSYGKTGVERTDFAGAVSGLSAIQEYVVERDPRNVPEGRGEISPGSALGDVVLVLSYDFACDESPTTGIATVSFLSVGQPTPAPLARSPSSYFSMAPNHSSPLLAPSHLQLSNTHPSFHVTGAPLTPSSLPPSSRSDQLASQHPRKSSSLRLAIPAPSTFLSPPHPSGGLTPLSAPSTPWLQVMHTPTEPPPFYPPSSSSNTRQTDRLEKEWVNLANPWEDRSPALMGVFPESSPGLSSSESDSPASNALGLLSPPQFEYDPTNLPYSQAMTELTSVAMQEVGTALDGFSRSLSTPLLLAHHQPGGTRFAGQGGSFFPPSSLDAAYGRSPFRPSSSIEEELAAVIDSEIALHEASNKPRPPSLPLREGDDVPTSPNSSLWAALMGN